MKKLYLSLLLAICCCYLSAQCPSASFTKPDTVCANQLLNLTNTSSGAEYYGWDFCGGDLAGTPDTANLGDFGMIDNSLSLSMIYDSTNWYGFVLNWSGDIIRLDFGSNVLSIPSAVNIGNPGGLLGGSGGDISFIKEGTMWYAFTTSFTGNRLVRLDFGASLTNTPTATNLGSLGLLSSPIECQVLASGDTIIVMVSNFTTNSLTAVRFINSVTNSVDTAYNINIPPAAQLYSIFFIKECNNWIGLATAFGNWKVMKIDFGSSFLNTPAITDYGSYGAQPVNIEIHHDAGAWYGFVRFRTQGIVRLNFGNSMQNSVQSSLYLGNFWNMISGQNGFTIAKDKSTQVAFAVNLSNELIRLQFPDTCYASDSASTAFEPAVSYSQSREYIITHIATDSLGNTSYFTDSVVVLSSPTSGFYVLSRCSNELTSFMDTSTAGAGVINNWTWDFDTGDSAFIQNPTYSYADTGWYNVTLITTNSGGCGDTITLPVRINPKPVAGYDYSSGQICESDTVFFADTSSVISGSISLWDWNFDNGDSSALQNPAYPFDSAGPFNVELIITTDSLCLDTFSSTITIDEKPDVDFTINNGCTGDTTDFINTTVYNSGSYTSFWNFGDTLTTLDTSSLQNPSYAYPDTGNYNVTLIVTGNNGCIDSIVKNIRISNKPSPAFGYFPNNPICQNSQVQFSDSSTVPGDTISAWIWDFDTGDSLFTKNPLYPFADNGTFYVTLIVTSGADCDSSVTDTITVVESPKSGFTSADICIGDATMFTDTSTGSNNSDWQWNFGDNFTDNVQNPTHTYADTGFYVVTLVVTNDTGCSSSVNDSIRIYSLPLADFTSQLACTDLNTPFIDLSTSADDTICNWEWHFNDPGSGSNDTSNLKNPNHIYDSTGTYTVELIVTTSNGCTDTITYTVNVQQSPVAGFMTSAVCEGDSVAFADTSSGTLTNWQWTFGDGDSSTIQGPRHLYGGAGNYSVFLQVTDLNGCYDTITQNVNVSYNPIAGFDFGNLCVNNPIPFFDTSSVINDTISLWEWVVVGFDSSNVQNPTFSLNQTILYQVTLKVTTGNGCSDATQANITVYDNPVADFSFTPDYGNPPLLVAFTDLSSNGAATWDWDFGDGQSSSLQQPTHLYDTLGTYIIKQVATTGFGCQDSATQVLKVRQPVLDIAVQSVVTNSTSNSMTVSTNLINLGTRDIYNYEIQVEVAKGSTIKEYWAGNLISGGSMVYTFNAAFEIYDGLEPEWICVEAIDPNGEQDYVPQNNKQCITNGEGFLVMDPYPNPADDQITIEYMIPASDQVDVFLYDVRGRLVKILFSGIANAGINSLTLYTDEISSGEYAYRILYRGTSQVKAFVKSE